MGGITTSFARTRFVWLAVAFLIGCSYAASGALQRATVADSSRDQLISTLRRYLGDQPKLLTDASYSPAFIDLNGDGTTEAIVLVNGSAWCGSGGCLMLVLRPQGTSYHVLSKTTLVHTPIRVLNSRTHGWRDISVRVQGGGIQPGYEALLQFNGTRYPQNPTVPPARPLKRSATADIAISATAPTTPLRAP